MKEKNSNLRFLLPLELLKLIKESREQIRSYYHGLQYLIVKIFLDALTTRLLRSLYIRSHSNFSALILRQLFIYRYIRIRWTIEIWHRSDRTELSIRSSVSASNKRYTLRFICKVILREIYPQSFPVLNSRQLQCPEKNNND